MESDRYRTPPYTMKNHAYRWAGGMLVAAALSSCYYYPVAGSPPNSPYNPYADEKSASVPVYQEDYVPPQPVAPAPVVARPAFTLGISLPPIFFGHHHHGHHHHHGCHRW